MADGRRVYRRCSTERAAERMRRELVEAREQDLDPTRRTLADFLRSWLASLRDAKHQRVRRRGTPCAASMVDALRGRHQQVRHPFSQWLWPPPRPRQPQPTENRDAGSRLGSTTGSAGLTPYRDASGELEPRDASPASAPQPTADLDVERLARALGGWVRYRNEDCDDDAGCEHDQAVAAALAAEYRRLAAGDSERSAT
jgi:hypothetical protein